MNINWKQKLSSRKFWSMIIGVITALLVLFNVDELTLEKISALISAEGVLIVYILTEGDVDSTRALTQKEEPQNEQLQDTLKN